MNYVIDIYQSYKNEIELIKDIVFFCGAWTLFQYIWNKRFTDSSKNIQHNLNKREEIEDKLNEYVYGKHKNKVDICIRFIHWKNYPYKLENDAYKHLLFMRPTENVKMLPSGYIDNTGINFVEPIGFFGNSIYIDKNDIFFFARKGSTFVGFKEFHDRILVMHLPFNNIINFDFREFIEYEPVFYIRYPYDKRKKLYDRKFILRSKAYQDWLMLELDQKNMMHKYSWINYNWFKFKLWVSSLSLKKIISCD